MMEGTISWQIEVLPWYALGLYWVVSALRVKRTRASEPITARLYTIFLGAAAFALLFSNNLRFGRLGERFLVRDSWLEAAGLALTYAGERRSQFGRAGAWGGIGARRLA